MMREIYRLLNVKQSTTTPYHAISNEVVENFNKTTKNLVKKVTAEKPKDWHRYLGPLMFAVKDTPQDSTGFTPFELLYGHQVRVPMMLLKRLWTGDNEDPEVKTSYQYVVDLKQRVEKTCELARNELAKVQTRNQKILQQKGQKTKIQCWRQCFAVVTNREEQTHLIWRGPYKVVGVIGDVDYRIQISPNKVKTYHINMLKRYFYRNNDTASLTANKSQNNTAQNKESVSVEQAELVACVLEDKDTEEEVAVKDAETLPLYNFNQKETVKDVVINPELSAAQQNEIWELLDEYSELFSDVLRVTHLIEHKVELTETEPVKHKPYPIPYKMQEIIDKEIDEMLRMGVIEHSEAPYAPSLVLVKKTRWNLQGVRKFQRIEQNYSF